MSDISATVPALSGATSGLAPSGFELGSKPLNPRHEAYARERSLLVPKAEAYRRAGFKSQNDQAVVGNANRLERNKNVAARIAYLTRQDEEILAEKRRRLEGFLWGVHETNYAGFWEMRDIAEDVLDEDGEPTGEKTIRRRQMLKDFDELSPEQQQMIHTLRFTEKGRPILETYSKMQANQELRKLLGIGSIARGGDDEWSRLADVELIATLQREAADLGIDVDLTMRFKGSEVR